MDKELELYRALRTSQDKYAYFLLAAAGAAIAFSVTQTRDDALAWPHLALGFAIFCWATSFLFGCRHLQYVNSTIYANHELLRIEAGRHPEVGNRADWVRAASEGIRSAIESNANNANRYMHWQFRLLVTGAVFFVFWHTFEMYLRTLPAAPPA